MISRVLAAGAVLLLSGAAVSAQAPAPATAGAQIKGQSPDRGRPTKHDDEQPLLDFDAYFLGAPWSFEWDVPEGPLGAAGRITGTTTYTALGGKFYEALTEAEGPDGKFTVRETIGYHKDYKALSRHVIDSRGFAFDEIAHVGADLGVMEADTKRMRKDKPYVMTNLKTHTGVAEVVAFIEQRGMLAAA